MTTIEKINYFGEETNSNEWNAKVLYRRNGTLHHCLLYVCFFRNEFYIPKNQHKECKVYQSLYKAIHNYKTEYFK